MIYCFDLDGTLCTSSPDDYTKALPLQERIDSVNRLFQAGYYIKIYTARGVTTNTDCQELTEWQLEEWDVDYDELIMGKPFADVYIDDKGVNELDFFKEKAWVINQE